MEAKQVNKMRLSWKIDRIINFQRAWRWAEGCAHLGFHDRAGSQYVVDYEHGWVGCLDANGRLRWSAGRIPIPESDLHIPADLDKPGYLAVTPDGKILVACTGNRSVVNIDLAGRQASTLIDGQALGMKDLGNCEYDLQGNLWANEVEGGRVWQFDPEGKPLQTLGVRYPGFQAESVPFEQAQFSWIFDLRRGPDGNIYVLDSMNFVVKKLDLQEKMVSTVVGTGKPGYSGDGGDARLATLGQDRQEYFGGPWSLSLDEAGNIFIGDTQNHVVRMVERATNIISTIAGKTQVVPGLRNNPKETDPLNLNLPRICSMDYWDGRLFIPEWDGDLVVLIKERI
jgi:outer membrane protein assembly factor BamB